MRDGPVSAAPRCRRRRGAVARGARFWAFSSPRLVCGVSCAACSATVRRPARVLTPEGGCRRSPSLLRSASARRKSRRGARALAMSSRSWGQAIFGGKPPDPKEQVKEWRMKLKKEMRTLEVPCVRGDAHARPHPPRCALPRCPGRERRLATPCQPHAVWASTGKAAGKEMSWASSGKGDVKRRGEKV